MKNEIRDEPLAPMQAMQAAAPLLDGRYRLDERLGAGAHGVVYRALHVDLKRPCAVKLLHPAIAGDPLSLARFRREAEALGRLRDPHIVEVSDFGIDAASGAPYLVLELLEGRTLADLCRTDGALPLGRALPLLEAIAAAIDTAHEHGILHRDLKPGNVFCGLPDVSAGEEPSAPALKVLDFGLAEISGLASLGPGAPTPPTPVDFAASGPLTATGAFLGTPLYAAPEVLGQGVASRASDVYSLGVIAYELLAGRPPFQGSVAEVTAGHLHGEPPVPALPAAVWQALRAPLHKDPAQRPVSGAAFVSRLRRAAARAELASWRRAEAPRRLAVAAAVAIASVGFGALLPAAGMAPVERRLDDLRFAAAPRRDPDPRLLLVTLDEASLGDGSVPLADRADELGRALSALFAAGARGVAVDLLLPAKWRESAPFTDAVLRHAGALTLAAFSAPDGSVLGTECVSGLTAAALGPRRAAAVFGFVNLDEDADGATRRGRLLYQDRAAKERPSWAARAAAALTARGNSPAAAGRVFRIDHRIDWRRYARLSWKDLPAALVHRPRTFRGRLVLVGGDFLASGDDYHRIPAAGGKEAAVSGLTLQALQVDTIAAGLPVREAPRLPALVLAALLSGGAAAGAVWARRAWRVTAGAMAACLLYTAATVLAFRWTGLLWPVSAPVLITFFALLTALALRRFLPAVPGSARSAS